MSNFEFRSYVATPSEKYSGIAEIKAWKSIVLRYKIVPKKDGSGFFPVPASYKVVENGAERYVSCFTIDSNSDKEDAEAVVMSNVRRIMQGTQGNAQQDRGFVGAVSGYQPQQSIQPGAFSQAAPGAFENVPF